MKFRFLIPIVFILVGTSLYGQQGDELLVYAVKGKVMAVFKNAESQVKVGKVLYPGTVLKTEKGSSITLLCSKGRPFVVNQEGTYPVSKWKDSCKLASTSLSSSFFKYIWGQMYVYSPEHKEEMRKKSELAVVRGEDDSPPGKKLVKLTFSKGMDTVHYEGINFPLSWNGVNYNKPYEFSLFNHAGKLLYRATCVYSYIPIDSFQHLLAEGNIYKWSVAAKGLPVSKKRILKYVTKDKMKLYFDWAMQPIPIEEDVASTYFRYAYLLEKGHYLASALQWYEKAMKEDPELELYRDQYIRFSNEFWIR